MKNNFYLLMSNGLICVQTKKYSYVINSIYFSVAILRTSKQLLFIEVNRLRNILFTFNLKIFLYIIFFSGGKMNLNLIFFLINALLLINGNIVVLR